MEMEFRTQWEILEYLGKSNDRNLIKRMEKRGEVRRWDWVYYLEVKDGEKEKEEKVDLKFISKAMWEKVLAHGEIARLNEELEKYKEWLDEANAAYEKLEAERDAQIVGITKRCWDYMFQRKCCPTQTKSQFEYRIQWKPYTDVQFSPDDLPF